jgi:SAM-dependent methyltransferase
MQKEELQSYLESEYEKKFSGWDFSYLESKMEEKPLPWNYRMILENYFKKAEVVLDMGTGGGEFLDSFKDLPKKIYATEGYKPNIEIAKSRLKKRNVIVKEINEDNILPFENNFFDLIVNRHEEYSISELYRVMKKNSTFITQQVGGLNDVDINACLGNENVEYFDWCLVKAMHELEKNGFLIEERKEIIGTTRFYDIGSIVYYLKCIPWQIEDFTVKKYIDKLEIIDRNIKKDGYKDFINHRFYLIAKKI